MIKVFLCDTSHDKFFGPGPYRLLLGVERFGSLRAAAQDMGMAYSKAFTIIKRAETALGFPLTCRKIGGTGGGGSVLTPEAKELMNRYADYESACREACGKLFAQHFPEHG